MKDLFAEIWTMLIGRQAGPLSFRLIGQPLVAATLGIAAGLKDARLGLPLYGWTIVSHPGRRPHLLLEGWNHVKRVFVAAVIIDVIYELIVFRWVYPGQALIVAASLTIPSYFLVRGVANRIRRVWLRDSWPSE